MRILTCPNHRDLRWSCTDRRISPHGHTVYQGIVFLGFYAPYLADGPYTMRRPDREHGEPHTVYVHDKTEQAHACTCPRYHFILAPEYGADGTERSTD